MQLGGKKKNRPGGERYPVQSPAAGRRGPKLPGEIRGQNMPH